MRVGLNVELKAPNGVVAVVSRGLRLKWSPMLNVSSTDLLPL